MADQPMTSDGHVDHAETLPPRTPARAARAERRPFRDNPRLILAGIVVLLVGLAALLALSPTARTRLSPDFLSEFVLYALSAADLTMLRRRWSSCWRATSIKLIVERRRGAAVRALPRQAGRAAARA